MPTKQKPTIIIDRQKWLRQDNKKIQPVSKLLCDELSYPDHRGQMCCLGFACRQLAGLTKKQIASQGAPTVLNHKSRKKICNSPLSFLLKEDGASNSRVCTDLMRINDNPKTPDKHKEKRIKETFKKNGVKVQFIN